MLRGRFGVEGLADDEESVFSTLLSQLDSKQRWQDKKYNLYEGKRNAPTLDISLNKDIDARIPAGLDWPRTAVDHLSDKLNYDLILNDYWGLNNLLQAANFDAVLESSIRSSLIGACSFVSVMPGRIEDGEPEVVMTAYTGKEATGIYNSRTNQLIAGLAIVGYDNNGNARDFRLFMRNGTYDIFNNGESVIKVSEGLGVVQLVPFVFKQDLASKPFGESRLTPGSIENLDKALRTLKRMELSSENYANPQRYISVLTAATDGEERFVEATKKLANIGSYLIMEGQAESIDFGEFSSQGPNNLISLMGTAANQFAASVSMLPSNFGFEPTNGSLSSEAIRERKKDLGNLIKKSQRNYSASILLVARISLLLRDGAVPEGFSNASPRWLNEVEVTDYGMIGDALGKVQEMVPVSRSEQFVLDALGISMRGLTQENETLDRGRSERRLTDVLAEINSTREALEVERISNDPKNSPEV